MLKDEIRGLFVGDFGPGMFHMIEALFGCEGEIM